MPRDINDSLRVKSKSKGFVTPTSSFIAPERNLASAYLSYLSGITDPNQLNKLANDSLALYGRAPAGNDDQGRAGLFSDPNKGSIYAQYQQMDAYYAKYDAQVAEQQRQIAEQKATVDATNLQNAQANAAQRRGNVPQVNPQAKQVKGILGLPLTSYEQAINKFGY